MHKRFLLLIPALSAVISIMIFIDYKRRKRNGIHTDLFLDDQRKCPRGFILARNYDECIAMLSKYNNVDVLSLDHDLGQNVPTGYDVAKWIVRYNRWPREIRLHSSNPIGRLNMYRLLSQHAPDGVIVGR